jgi:hypothetical protein
MPIFATPSTVSTGKLKVAGAVAANSALVLPANALIDYVVVLNTTANAITGGLKFGTTAGATDITVAVAIAGNALIFITDALLLRRIFSTSATQQIFFDAVAAWNSASVDVTIVYKQL